MKNKGLFPCVVLVCALSLAGCKKSATDTGTNPAGSTDATAQNAGGANSAGANSGGNSSEAASDAVASTPAPKPIIVKPGTEIVVTADQSVSSKTSNSGDHFDASLAEPVVVNDRVVIPKGAHATGTVLDAKSAGKFKGNAELRVSLSSVTVKGKEYRVKTTAVTESGKSRGKRTAVGAGGGAVAGALIGALAGRGKGAAIGAAAGAGAGTAGAAMTGERDITINSESKLSFKLEDTLEIERK
jgi:outer membrane lipoprotein SlyB